MDSAVTWQFNFLFDRCSDHYRTEALQVLELAGIDFDKHSKDGIKLESFQKLFQKSNLLGNSLRVSWLAFNARYDFGYLLHLTGQRLPFNEDYFVKLCGDQFGKFYDVKLLRDDRGSLHQ